MFVSLWKPSLALTYYQLLCPINCTFSNKKTTNMHPCELHISGLDLGDMKLGFNSKEKFFLLIYQVDICLSMKSCFHILQIFTYHNSKKLLRAVPIISINTELPSFCSLYIINRSNHTSDKFHEWFQHRYFWNAYVNHYCDSS